MPKPAKTHPWKRDWPVKGIPLKEVDIQRQILDYLKANHIFAWRQNTGGVPLGDGKGFRPAAAKGVPDIIGVLKGGRMLAIEVKRPGSYATLEQKTFIAKLREAGALAFVAYSLDNVIAMLKEEGW